MPVLLTERDGQILSLTLNRPERANALSGELIESLRQAFEKAESSNDIAVVTLTGAGGNFCSGADTDEIRQGGARKAIEGYVALVSLLSRFPKPLLVGVDGGAVGGGLGLVALGDVVIATDRAQFRTPELKLGLFPFIIAPLLTPIIGNKRFFEMVYTGRPVSATEAQGWGLVNQVVKTEALPGSLNKLAVSLAAAPLAPLTRGKRAVQQGRSLKQMGKELLGLLEEKRP